VRDPNNNTKKGEKGYQDRPAGSGNRRAERMDAYVGERLSRLARLGCRTDTSDECLECELSMSGSIL
jgi:hypothetical protein